MGMAPLEGMTSALGPMMEDTGVKLKSVCNKLVLLELKVVSSS